MDVDGATRPAQARAERAQQDSQGLLAWDPKKVTAAARSSLFHPYVAVALRIEAVPQALASSAEACPCHQALLKNPSEHKRRVALEGHYGPGVLECTCARSRASSCQS